MARIILVVNADDRCTKWTVDDVLLDTTVETVKELLEQQGAGPKDRQQLLHGLGTHRTIMLNHNHLGYYINNPHPNFGDSIRIIAHLSLSLLPLPPDSLTDCPGPGPGPGPAAGGGSQGHDS
jgi:hypothetical protein